MFIAVKCDRILFAKGSGDLGPPYGKTMIINQEPAFKIERICLRTAGSFTVSFLVS